MNLLTDMWTSLREVWTFRHEPEHFRRLADFYWGSLLFLAFTVVVSTSIYGALKFMEITRGKEEDIFGSSGGLPLLNKKDLQATLDGFAERAAVYEALKTASPQIADPSR